ncbi:hypothetical protein EPO33_00795 [Patescibacteria group bacterium]|nr:MAG: hypothetical protein EPO33_00795 [Patescibacteria group bacterium]
MARYGKAAQKSVKRAVSKYKRRKLHSGKARRVVRSRAQAIAIGLSMARKKGAKVPPPRVGAAKGFVYMNAIIAIIIALVLGGGVSVAANTSLPGDVLHPIKVQVNERVRVGLSVSAEAKAGTNGEIAVERLNEAERLAVDGRLDGQTRAQVETNFSDHAGRVQALIDDLEDADVRAAADIASNLETSLKAHEQVLAQLEADIDSQSEAAETAALRGRVGEEARAFERIRVDLEGRLKAQADVRAAAEGRIGAATNKIAEVRRYIAGVRARLSAEATARGEARLSAADTLLVEARARLAAGANGEAFQLASQAHRTAQDAQIMAASQLRLRIELRVGSGAATGTGPRANVNVNTNDNENDNENENENENENVNVNANANANANLNLNVNVNLP